MRLSLITTAFEADVSRLHVPLTNVPSEVRCAKPGCQEASHAHLQRHHKGHQAMWLGIWASRRRGETKFADFVIRYHLFLPADVVLICDSHHAEIHSIYDKIINEDRARTGASFSRYSWRQAEMLMAKLIVACDDWLEKESPGLDSNRFSETRSVYKSLLRKGARRRPA